MSSKKSAKNPENNISLWDNVRVLCACVDYYGFVHSLHSNSFARFMYDASDLIKANRLVVEKSSFYMIDYERSKFAWRVQQQQNEFTHLFFFDADMEVRLDAITKLLERNVDIVSGTYYFRVVKKKNKNGIPERLHDFPCVSTRRITEEIYVSRQEIELAGKRNELLEVTHAGAGCLLISAQCLRDVGQPAFKCEWEIGGSFFRVQGEDDWFCTQARKAGYKIYLDPTVLIPHYSVIQSNHVLHDSTGEPFFKPEY